MTHQCPDDHHDHILDSMRATPGIVWPLDDDDADETGENPDAPISYRLAEVTAPTGAAT